MEIKKKRLNYVDMVKGLAIITVVCYHLLAPNTFRTVVIDHIMMPLLVSFFFFAGFFHKPGKLSFWENVKARAKALLVPFFLYSLIFWLIGSHYLVISKQETILEALGCLRNFYAGCIWNRVIQNWFAWDYYKLGSRYLFLAGFWFLPALFFASVLFFPIAEWANDDWKKTGIAAVLLFAATAVLRGFKVDLPYNLQIVPFWSAFLLLGMISRQKKIFELEAVSGVKGWICSVLALAAGLLIAFLREPVLNSFRGYFPEPEVLSMLICIIFSLMFIWGLGSICRLTEEAGCRVTELSWVGCNSLTIYLFHYFFAWVISVIFGFSLRYANPAPDDVFWKSAAVTAGAFMLSVLLAVIKNKISEAGSASKK